MGDHGVSTLAGPTPGQVLGPSSPLPSEPGSRWDLAMHRCLEAPFHSEKRGFPKSRWQWGHNQEMPQL